MTNKQTSLRQYLYSICEIYGFCLSPAVQQDFADNPGTCAKAFVKRVILAEGLGAQGIDRHFEALHSYLSKHVATEMFA